MPLFDGVACNDQSYYMMLEDSTSYIKKELKNVTFPMFYQTVSFWFYMEDNTADQFSTFVDTNGTNSTTGTNGTDPTEPTTPVTPVNQKEFLFGMTSDVLGSGLMEIYTFQGKLYYSPFGTILPDEPTLNLGEVKNNVWYYIEASYQYQVDANVKLMELGGASVLKNVNLSQSDGFIPSGNLTFVLGNDFNLT